MILQKGVRGAWGAHCVVHNALERLKEDQDVGRLAAGGDPVIVVVLRQLVDLLQGEARTHAPQVGCDVKALSQHPPTFPE